jgi:hypothetical protein
MTVAAPVGPPFGAVAEALARAANPARYDRWEQLVAQTGYCSHPVRLSGRVTAVDRATGEAAPMYESAAEPDGVLLTACGNRRENVCPTCSATYRADTWQLVAAGLRGGKGVPATVTAHPRLFVTVTAPSFGAVHSARKVQHRAQVCRPRMRRKRCPHGRPVGCPVRHGADDPVLGTPICPDCYDYAGAVLFNAYAPELWRRLTQDVTRQLAHRAGLSQRQLRELVRLAFVKVAEGQRRGLVHFHAVFRLDAAGDPLHVAPPPARFTAEMLAGAIRAAAARVEVTTPPIRAGAPGVVLRFGEQLDIRTLPTGREDDGAGSPGRLDERTVAAYLAKYVTKSTTSTELSDRRFTDADFDALDPAKHLDRMALTAWELAAVPGLADRRLRRWAHMLGFRGHVSSKSRRYSTTMTALRRARVEHRVAQRCTEGGQTDPWGRPLDSAEDTGTVLLIADWRFAGVGHRTAGDAWLAQTAAANARERRNTARLALRTTAGGGNRTGAASFP